MRNSELTELVTFLFALAQHRLYVPLLVWGEAGIGKSETIRRTAFGLDIDFIDLRLGNLEAPDLLGQMRDETVYPCVFHLEEAVLDPLRTGERFTGAGLWHHAQLHHRAQIPKKLASDPIGFVAWNLDRITKMGYASLVETRTVYSAPSWFPAPDTSGILFLDEMNRSHRETRQGVFQLVLDRRIHELELPDGWIIVSANNPPSSTGSSGLRTYDVDDMSDKAFLSRFCHVVLDSSAAEWAEYARDAGIEATIRTLLTPAGNNDERTRKLLGLRRASLPDLEPTPRGWTMLGRIMDAPEGVRPLTSQILSEVVQGLVGEKTWAANGEQLPVASRFLGFLEEMGKPGTSEEAAVLVEEVVDAFREGDPAAKTKLEAAKKKLHQDEASRLEDAVYDVVPR